MAWRTRCSTYATSLTAGTHCFDVRRQKENKERMLSVMAMIVSRLDQINDGSFAVDDRETPYLREL